MDGRERQSHHPSFGIGQLLEPVIKPCPNPAVKGEISGGSSAADDNRPQLIGRRVRIKVCQAIAAGDENGTITFLHHTPEAVS